MSGCTDWDSGWGPCGRCTHCLTEQGSQKLDSVEARLERMEEAINEIRTALRKEDPSNV